MSQLETPITSQAPMHPTSDAGSPSPGGAVDGPGPLITEGPFTNRPEWSRRRALITGTIVGAFFGMIFFAGYAGASAWICSSRLDCGHWAPIAIVSGIGAFVTMLLGAAGALILHKIYGMFKVA